MLENMFKLGFSLFFSVEEQLPSVDRRVSNTLKENILPKITPRITHANDLEKGLRWQQGGCSIRSIHQGPQRPKAERGGTRINSGVTDRHAGRETRQRNSHTLETPTARILVLMTRKEKLNISDKRCTYSTVLVLIYLQYKCEA